METAPPNEKPCCAPAPNENAAFGAAAPGALPPALKATGVPAPVLKEKSPNGFFAPGDAGAMALPPAAAGNRLGVGAGCDALPNGMPPEPLFAPKPPLTAGALAAEPNASAALEAAPRAEKPLNRLDVDCAGALCCAALAPALAPKADDGATIEPPDAAAGVPNANGLLAAGAAAAPAPNALALLCCAAGGCWPPNSEPTDPGAPPLAALEPLPSGCAAGVGCAVRKSVVRLGPLDCCAAAELAPVVPNTLPLPAAPPASLLPAPNAGALPVAAPDAAPGDNAPLPNTGALPALALLAAPAAALLGAPNRADPLPNMALPDAAALEATAAELPGCGAGWPKMGALPLLLAPPVSTDESHAIAGLELPGASLFAGAPKANLGSALVLAGLLPPLPFSISAQSVSAQC